MQSTNIKFIYHVVEKDQLRFFTIYNVNGATVYDFRDEDSTPDKVITAIDTFLSMNFGVFKINFRRTPKPSAGRISNIWQYTVNNMDNSKSTEAPIGNADGLAPSDDRFYTIFREMQNENKELQSDKIATMLSHLTEQNRLQMELMTKNFELANQNKDDGMNQIAMQAIGAIFGGSTNALAGVTGMGDSPVSTVDSETELNPIETAVRGLMDIDPNFEDNISGLHKLAVNNKPMYDIAIVQLKNFK